MPLRERLRSDVRAVLDRDPATDGALEVLLTAPGLYAIWSHRLAHWLWRRDHRLLARVLATLTRLVTGVEIHPGAELGERVVIDHGQGTVVGATASVGDDVLLYHGVTLGSREERTGQRHPTVDDGVTLGANATVLGDVTVGEGATVGAGAVVVDPVSPGETVVGVPAEPVDADEERSSTSTGAVGAGSDGAAHGARGDGEPAHGDDEPAHGDADATLENAEATSDEVLEGADAALEDAEATSETAPEDTGTAVGGAEPEDEASSYQEYACEPPWP